MRTLCMLWENQLCSLVKTRYGWAWFPSKTVLVPSSQLRSIRWFAGFQSCDTQLLRNFSLLSWFLHFKQREMCAIEGCVFTVGKNLSNSEPPELACVWARNTTPTIHWAEPYTQKRSPLFLHKLVHLPAASGDVYSVHFQEEKKNHINMTKLKKNQQMNKKLFFGEKSLSLGIIFHINLLMAKYYILLFIKYGQK